MNIHYFDIVSVGHVSVVQPLNYPVPPLPVGLHDLSLLHRELHHAGLSQLVLFWSAVTNSVCNSETY